MKTYKSFYSLLISGALLFSCQSSTEKTPEPEAVGIPSAGIITLTEAQAKNAGIETGGLELRRMTGTLAVNGVVDVPPQNLVSISFPLGGYLKSTDLLPGMKVKRGDAIAVMEDPAFLEMQQDFLTIQKKLEYLKLEYERQKLLNATKTSSDKVFEQAASEYESARITHAALREKLYFLNIPADKLTENTLSRSVRVYSPIDGYVTAVHVNIGKYVAPTEVLFDLVNPTDLHLALKVFEKDLPLVEIGQKVTAHPANHPERVYEAEVILGAKMLDNDRSAEIHCHFTQPYPELIPGMYLNGEIAITQGEVDVLPEAAVVRSGDSEFVFVEQTPMHYEMQKVQTGTTSEGFVQILPGGPSLKGRKVVVRNAYAILMKKENVPEEE